VEDEGLKELIPEVERLNNEKQALIDAAYTFSYDSKRYTRTIVGYMEGAAKGDRVEKELSAKIHNMEEEFRTKWDALNNEYIEFKTQHTDAILLREQLQIQKRECERLEKERADVKAEFNAKTAVWDDSKARMDAALLIERDKYEAAREELNEAKIKIARLDKNELLEEVEKLKLETRAAAPRIIAAEDKVKVLEHELAKSKERSETFSSNLKEQKLRADNLCAAVQHHEKTKFEAIAKYDGLKEVNTALENRVTEFQKKYNNQLSENNQLKDKIKELEVSQSHTHTSCIL
jgi:chromosome segregation ATPase